MIVEQIWTGNAYRNYNYVVACSETGEAIAIDPLDHAKCLAVARGHGWEITKIVNTHEHADHTGGNDAVVAATGAKVHAHARAADRVPGLDVAVAAGERITAGRTVALEVLETPGHTFAHICLYADGDAPCLFCGDTLFNAGVGNTGNGGDTDTLFATFASTISRLPDATRVFPGHDYIEKNITFSLALEPSNPDATELQASLVAHDPAAGFVRNLGEERRVNGFLRLGSAELIEQLRERMPGLAADPPPVEVFRALRKLRDSW